MPKGDNILEKLFKHIYRRLDDNTIIIITEYKNELGRKDHFLDILYEDNNQRFYLGCVHLRDIFTRTVGCDKYIYNNNYVVISKYNPDKKMLETTSVFDIKARCELLTDNEFGNIFRTIEAEDNIRFNKCKGKRLRNYRTW